MNSLISTLDEYFGKKAPQLPVAFKEFLVRILPFIAIISAIAMLPSIFGLFGSAASVPFAYYGYGPAGGFGISTILNLASLALYALAFSGLSKRTIRGWNLVFYAVLLTNLGILFSAQIITFVISLAFGMYLLFQIRPYYTGGVTTSTTSTV